MEYVMQVPAYLKTIRETRFSALKGPGEFFDYHRVSRPADMNEATSRISYNTRYFSGNYLLIILGLAIYAIITRPLLLIALLILVGGFAAINRFAPEPLQLGEHVITQKTLYIALFVIGLPLLWWASPVWTFFWLVGSSAFIILFHAALMEPGIESEYGNMADNTNV
ncbi:prenylated rab acceptor PRA1 [Calocera viscosa TUFC12733]|uniref:PRA1 family protein n=1 Tax=Calocera viscosa (strain TUFC12733) TaxID=1330018 RepID=A0A167LBY1_CALVF|nr:prenylated rab acceptor PRA1 [Calocera viscosa TUFC12733]